MSDPQSEIFLGRQPILDRKDRLVAYELLFRSGRDQNTAQVSDDTQATATVIANAFAQISFGDALGPYRGFINVDRDFLFSDVVELLPRDCVTLEVLETVEPTPEVVERCQYLRAKGFMLAIDDLGPGMMSPEYAPLLSVVDVIKVDVQMMSPAELIDITEALKPLGKQLLAEKVDTLELVELCRDLGFDLFQGYYFARPTIISGKKLEHSYVVLMRLMMLISQDAETTDLAQVLKQEPGLTINLLRLTNSVASGLRTRITSLRHAIVLLGRSQLQRWIQLLLFINPNSQGTPGPLLQMAAARGRLMELLVSAAGSGHSSESSDQAFMTGVMSLMPVVLGISIQEILAQLSVAEIVAQALNSGSGRLGTMLRLAKASEGDDAEAIQELLNGLGGRITPPMFNYAVAEAMAWANMIGVEIRENA